MGRDRVFIITLLALLSSFLHAEIVDSIVAKVDTRIYTYSEIMQEGALLNIENKVPFNTPLSQELKKMILEKYLIIKDILFKESRGMDIVMPEKELKKAVNKYRSSVFLF